MEQNIDLQVICLCLLLSPTNHCDQLKLTVMIGFKLPVVLMVVALLAAALLLVSLLMMMSRQVIM